MFSGRKTCRACVAVGQSKRSAQLQFYAFLVKNLYAQ